MTTDYTKLGTCLACGGIDLVPYCDLGVQPLANDFRPIPPTQTTVEWTDYPLGLQVCTACWHSQNLVAVDPAILYTGYNYVSGTSASLRQYFGEFVDRVERDFKVGFTQIGDGLTAGIQPFRKLHVLEIACNDGTLLTAFKARGHYVWGIDPAQNVADMAMAEGVPVTVGFWGQRTVELLRQTLQAGPAQFDVIVAMNVLGHVADPLTFLQLAKRVLAPGGRIYVQTSQAHMVERGEFDTVYHEPLSFCTARSFQALAKRAGLHIAQHEIADVHGGSHFVVLQDATGQQLDDDSVYRAECDAGIYSIDIYELFQQRTRDRLDLVRQALGLYRAGRRVVGYGAAAKSMTFVNALIAWSERFPKVSITPVEMLAAHVAASRPRGPIDYFVDDSPLKQNTLCPGSGIPVYAPDRLDGELGPILFVLTAWTMKDEIIARIKARRPGKRDLFLTYFPSIELKG